MDISVLQSMVEEGLTKAQIARKLNVDHHVIQYQLRKHGIKTKRKRFCQFCKETDVNLFDASRYTVCIKCRNKRHRRKKIGAVNYKGGKCAKCGYSKCLGALDFHHNDPKEKDHQWRNLRKMSFTKITKELDKCTLLCKNCHAEIHWKE